MTIETWKHVGLMPAYITIAYYIQCEKVLTENPSC